MYTVARKGAVELTFHPLKSYLDTLTSPDCETAAYPCIAAAYAVHGETLFSYSSCCGRETGAFCFPCGTLTDFALAALFGILAKQYPISFSDPVGLYLDGELHGKLLSELLHSTPKEGADGHDRTVFASILEKITHTEYTKLGDKLLFSPLSLGHTSFIAPGAEKRIPRYIGGTATFLYTEQAGTPMLYSTPEDLVRMAGTLCSSGCVGTFLRAWMADKQSKWNVFPDFSGASAGIVLDASGCFLYAEPEKDLVFAVLHNRLDPDTPDMVIRRIGNLILGDLERSNISV